MNNLQCSLPDEGLYKLGVLDLPPIVFTDEWQKEHSILIKEVDVWVKRVWVIYKCNSVDEYYQCDAIHNNDTHEYEMEFAHGFKPSDYEDGEDYEQERDDETKDMWITHKSRHRGIIVKNI